MKILLLIIVVPASVFAQFITPTWRSNADTEHAAWDVFTEAKFEPNAPDLQSDTPTSDASLTCFTSSAFLTSSGNIYSFQSATNFQLKDSTNFPIKNVFLQISGLGSRIDLTSVRIITNDAEGNPQTLSPTRNFIINQEALTGERGGLGTSYAFQWDLSSQAITGAYSILFEASESSLSLDQVSLDTSTLYEVVPEPELSVPTPAMTLTEAHITLAWPETFTLESSQVIATWAPVTDTPTIINGQKQLTLSLSNSPTFFRLKQTNVTP